MQKSYARGLMWFRRDLRCSDNAALYHALKNCGEVYCVFVFDTDILDALPREDRRVEFIRESLVALDSELRTLCGRAGAGLIVRRALASTEIPRLAHELGVQAVYANHDYEPLAIDRDAAVRSALAIGRVALHTSKDHVIFERDELLTQSGKPYAVFTPYKTAWLKKVDAFYLQPYAVAPYARALADRPASLRRDVPALRDIGFAQTNLAIVGIRAGERASLALFNEFRGRMARYHQTRDFPAIKGPSYLSVHLRFGSISLRQLAAAAHEASARGSAGAAVWLSELIWRDFYFQILANFPHVVTRSFKPAYDAIEWEHGQHALALFRAWCEGRTGYPIVDAAMQQINQTGYM
ncbi:MAG: cryptochrome/photolyase family protein, partial [Gammaproteobacteria bacterium]